jgi:PAS domain S-box-containing protein
MIWVSGRDKLCNFFNKGWLDFRGRTLEQEAGNGWVEGVHPGDAERCRNAYITAFDACREYSVEYRLMRNDGEYRWILQSGVPRLAPDGEFVGYIGCAIDIGERKLAEQAVQKSEAKFSGILSIAADAIISVDESHRITLFNEGAEKIFGYSKTEALGQSLDLLIPEKFRAIHSEHVRAFARSSTPARQMGDRQEIFGLRKGGEIFPAEASISQLAIYGQKIFTVVLRDITRRIEIEEALRASEGRLLLAMDAARIGYWEVDLTTGKVIRSESLERIFGLPPGSLPAHQEAFFALVHPEDVARLRLRAQTIPDHNREGANIEYRILRPDGTVRWIASRGQRTLGADGKLTRISGLSIDITERRQAEEALREALEEVRQLKAQVEEENVYLQKEVSETHRYGEIVGRSEKIAGIVFQAGQVASTDMTVLIAGETGTGKELVARAVHAKSSRRGRPLVKVNCAALPEPLIESELFGHEKGAFTGASGRQVGRFELADGGTIFLDEIGDLPLGLQAKLLRVLQEGEFERLGSSKTVKVDVRVIAATNRDLTQAMQRGSFRSDLYYRLNVYPIRVPALREHKEDIGELAELFLAEAGRRLGRRFEAIPDAILEALQSYDWPGNVRELQNVIERAAVTTLGRALTLPEGWDLRVAAISQKEQSIARAGETPPISDRAITLEDMERSHILRVLLETHWRIDGPKGAAVRLGLHPNTLRSRMTKLGIGRQLVS